MAYTDVNSSNMFRRRIRFSHSDYRFFIFLLSKTFYIILIILLITLFRTYKKYRKYKQAMIGAPSLLFIIPEYLYFTTKKICAYGRAATRNLSATNHVLQGYRPIEGNEKPPVCKQACTGGFSFPSARLNAKACFQ